MILTSFFHEDLQNPSQPRVAFNLVMSHYISRMGWSIANIVDYRGLFTELVPSSA
jgi:hypothetical protein